MPASGRSVKNFIPFLILVFIAIVANWPLWMYSMKFDTLDQYLPWRMLTGDTLRNGMLPLWNPYTHLGYPLHADPQSGAWYPIVWLIGTTIRYNLYTIHFEYLLHVCLAGVGMFILVKEVVKDQNIALLAGISYMLSGFFTGNAQHLTWIISGAWLPYILFSFLMMKRTLNRKFALYGALAFFMMFTGGYPAFTIMTVYLLILLSVWVIIKHRKSDYLKNHLLNISLLALFALLLSSPMIVSTYESFQLAGRAEGLSRDKAMANPFSPQCLISFLFPLSSLRNPPFFDTDVSMSNGFFGVMLLLGFIINLFSKKTFIEKTILAGSILCLCAAMGSYMPVRGWMYDFIPLMKLFRMPSLFRLFAITGFVLLASSILHRLYIKDKLQSIKKHLIITAIVAAVVPVAMIFLKEEIILPSDYSNMEEVSFAGSFLLQGIIIVISIVVMFFVIKKQLPVYFLTIDLVLSAWICAPVTLVNKLKTSEVNARLKAYPDDFPIPSTAPMEQFQDRTNIIPPFWCNLGILNRQPIYDGYNNFQTRQFLDFEASSQFRFVLKNPIVYFTDPASTGSFVSGNDTTAIYKDNSFLYLDKFSSMATSTTAGSSYTIKEFKPTYISIETSSAKNYLTLQQQYQLQWTATIDDQPAEIIRSNGFTMSVLIPEGKHTVVFNYVDGRIVKALWISAIGFVLMIVILVRNRRTN